MEQQWKDIGLLFLQGQRFTAFYEEWLSLPSGSEKLLKLQEEIHQLRLDKSLFEFVMDKQVYVSAHNEDFTDFEEVWKAEVNTCLMSMQRKFADNVKETHLDEDEIKVAYELVQSEWELADAKGMEISCEAENHKELEEEKELKVKDLEQALNVKTETFRKALTKKKIQNRIKTLSQSPLHDSKQKNVKRSCPAEKTAEVSGLSKSERLFDVKKEKEDANDEDSNSTEPRRKLIKIDELVNGMMSKQSVRVKILHVPCDVSKRVNQYTKQAFYLFEAIVGNGSSEHSLFALGDDVSEKASTILTPLLGQVVDLHYVSHKRYQNHDQIVLENNFEVDVVDNANIALKRQELSETSLKELPSQDTYSKVHVRVRVHDDSEVHRDRNGKAYRGPLRLVDIKGFAVKCMVWGSNAESNVHWQSGNSILIRNASVQKNEERLEVRDFSAVVDVGTFSLPSRINFIKWY